MNPQVLWDFLVPGYLFSIAIETPVLLVGLSRRHSLGVRLFAGVWLTACTYPIVVLVLPLLIASRPLYLLVAETFAPVAECALFWFTFGQRTTTTGVTTTIPPDRWSTGRDLIAITLANLASFGLGEVGHQFGWWELGG